MNNNIAIIYGSTTGNIESSAEYIATCLSPEKVQLFDIAVDDFDYNEFDVLIFGISTWEYGGLQEDWIDYFPVFNEANFTGKICTQFGQGDQDGYDEWYQDALGDIHKVLKNRGGTVIGLWPNEGYHFKASKGLTEDGNYFLGLSLDDDNQPELSEKRIEQWVAQLKISINELRCELA